MFLAYATKQKKHTTDQSRNGNHCNPLVENLDGRPFDSFEK